MQNKTWHQDFRRKVEAIHPVIVLDLGNKHQQKERWSSINNIHMREI